MSKDKVKAKQEKARNQPNAPSNPADKAVDPANSGAAAAIPPAASADATADKTRSIVDPKYRDRYKGKEKDFVGKFIDEQTMVNSADGKSKMPSLQKLFELALANGADSKKIDNYRLQDDSHGFGGRMRMTIGNILRAVAKQRHGLIDLSNTFHPIDESFKSTHGLTSPTHSPGGEKISKVKEGSTAAASTPAA